MATTTTVNDIYNRVTEVFLEPYNDGAYPGMSLGLFTLDEFLQMFGAVLAEFIERTNPVYVIFTQQVQLGVLQYLYPSAVMNIDSTYIGGQWINHETLFSLDNWQYNWRGEIGQPVYWHEDGLPQRTLELAPAPDYNGEPYTITDPSSDPPYGFYGRFNLSEPGVYIGTVNTSGTAVTWASGTTFDTNWALYSNPTTITIGSTAYLISSVTDEGNIVLQSSAGTNTNASYSVVIGNDMNLTIVGTLGLSTYTFGIDDAIPIVPDSLCPYLVYGVLQRIWSADGETKDMQRATYAQARFTEGINLCAAITGALLMVDARKGGSKG